MIAFGGGSGLDMGKLIAFMAGQTRRSGISEDIGDYWTPRRWPHRPDHRGADYGGYRF